jgi:urease accessory protein
LTDEARPRPLITREDFPTPPELAGRDPALAPGEHVGGLRAELRVRDGEVRLGRCYHQNPLRLMSPIAERPGGPALLLLMNSTAGLLDGDGQLVELDVGPGARIFVTNQSAGRIHPCPHWHASARFDLRVAAGAVLCALPGPTIPFAGSRFYQKSEIRLEPGASAVWGDILLPGRTHFARAPERFAFDRLVQELRVVRGGRTVAYERFAWAGPWSDAEVDWHFGDAAAAAALFVTGRVPPEELPELPGGEVAAMVTAAGDTCVRMLGRDPEWLIAAAARLALTAAARLAGDASPWFVGSNRLAPGHWFNPAPEHRCTDRSGTQRDDGGFPCPDEPPSAWPPPC